MNRLSARHIRRKKRKKKGRLYIQLKIEQVAKMAASRMTAKHYSCAKESYSPI